MLAMTLAGLVAMVPSALGQTPVKVERTRFEVWSDCWKVSNGHIEVVVVPQVGRVMRFGRVGGPNLLWVNQALVSGAQKPVPGEWANYGGDKLWPSPQRWGWPPDPTFDGQPHQCKPIPNGVRLTSPAGTREKVRFTRDITLAPGAKQVVFRNQMQFLGAEPEEWAIWQVTQIDDPARMFLPLAPDQFPPKGFVWMGSEPALPQGTVTAGPKYLVVRRDSQTALKVGNASPISTVWGQVGKDYLGLWVEHKKGATYPEGGCSLQIFCSPDPLDYVELEVTGPLLKLKPSQTIRVETRWLLADSEPR